MAEQSLEERLAAFEKKAQKALDYGEIQNVFALHEYYHDAPEEEIEMIFAKKQPDVSFGQNWGIWVGLESVKAYYHGDSEEDKKRKLAAIRKYYPDLPDDIKYASAGEAGFHTLTTPLIEIADDGVTAKGMWYTPGYLTFFNGETGEHQAVWMFEKYAIDFVKEDGVWKVWHFNVHADFMTPFEKSWVKSSLEKGERMSGHVPLSPDVPPIGYEDYHVRRVQSMHYPKPPVPYRTFSETFTYGPTKEQLAKINIKVNY